MPDMPESGSPPTSVPPLVETILTDEPLESLEAFRRIGSTSDGAVLTFEGRVRDHNEGRRVSGLAYEAYPEMAERELRGICDEAAVRFDVGAIIAAHRFGPLDLGEVSVRIAIAAPHRAACYEASRFIIEELKVRVPVWKHEAYADGSTRWVGAVDADAPRGPLTPGAQTEGPA
jgi:molybdopterin synthase catalytic subunit